MSFSETVKGIEERENALMVEKGLEIRKAMSSNNPFDIIKAKEVLDNVTGTQFKGKNERKSIVFDPFYSETGMGYLDKTFSVNDKVLRNMSRQSPIIKSIITTRTEQISTFTQPQYERFDTGFIIRPKRKFGESNQEAMKRGDKKIVLTLTDFIVGCGVEGNRWDNDDFNSFTRKVINDSLTLDKLVFEVVRNRKGMPTQICSTDTAITKLTDIRQMERMYGAEKKVNGYYPTYCQVYDGRILSDFYPWEMTFGIRNPTSDLRGNGYGMSELEDLVYTVTSLLWTDEYNARFFKQGSMPKGILRVSQDVNESKLSEFRQEWMSLVSGVSNAHRTPIVNAEKFEWIDLHKANREMEYSQWQEYLIKLSCAVYKIDPSEIGFNFSGTSGKAPMFESNNEQKLKYSQDKGLKSLLKFYEFTLNRNVISQINPEYELVFVGLNTETEQQEDERLTRAAGVYMTVNEVRASKGMKPIQGGDIILNPVFMQAQSMNQQQRDESNAKDNDVDENEVKNPYSSEEPGDVKKSVLDDIESYMRSNLLN